MPKTHLIIDANNLLHRAFYVSNLHDKKGRRTSGIYGTINMMQPLLAKFKPDNVVIAWDIGKSKERLAIYPEYKAQREKNRSQVDMDSLIFQKETLQKIFSFLPVSQIMVRDIEADDAIGYLSEKLKGNKIVVSNDQDFYQLIDATTKVFFPNKKIVADESNVEELLGFPVKHYILWKCMVGDTSDNIKGVNGIGPAKAKAIILNGLNGGKKPVLPKTDQAIIQRNKDLITIGALLQPDQITAIRKQYKDSKAAAVDFNSVMKYFIRHNFDTLIHEFEYWKKPWKKLADK